MRECVTIVDDVDDSNGIVDDCGVFEIEPLQQDPSFSTKVREPDGSALRSFIRRGSWFMLLFATVTVLSEEIYLSAPCGLGGELYWRKKEVHNYNILWPSWPNATKAADIYLLIFNEEGSTE